MKELSRITEDIIHDNLQYTRLRNGCTELINYFTSLIDFDLESREGITHIETPTGLAVSPFSAVSCVTDIMRTRVFLRSIKQAIEDKLDQNSNRPLIVLYAGTGPFATLFTPLTSIFKPEQVKFLLLELNSNSIKCFSEIIKKLQIEDYVLDLVETDAAKYKIPEQYEVDILVSEVMREGLIKEPQVFVTANLVTQCKHDVVIVPESIHLSLALFGRGQPTESNETEVSELLVYDKDFAIHCASSNYADKIFNQGLVFEINEKPSQNFNSLIIRTTIAVYKDELLRKNESSLTLPVHISDILHFKYPQKLLAKYVISECPQVVITCID